MKKKKEKKRQCIQEEQSEMENSTNLKRVKREWGHKTVGEEKTL